MSDNDGRHSATAQQDVQQTSPAPEVLAEESLIDEVSIDGMCGVY